MLSCRSPSCSSPICFDSNSADPHWFIYCFKDIGYAPHCPVDYLILITVHLLRFVWQYLEVSHTRICVLSYISRLIHWVSHLCLPACLLWVIVWCGLKVYCILDNVGISVLVQIKVWLAVRPHCIQKVIMLLCSTRVLFGMGHFKDFWIIASGGIISLQYYLLALIISASCYQNCVFCYMTLLSISCSSSIMFHMAAMSDFQVGSSSPRLLFKSYSMSTVNCFLLQLVLSSISSSRSIMTHWVRIGVAQVSSDLRFFMLNSLQVKHNSPFTALLKPIVDHWWFNWHASHAFVLVVLFFENRGWTHLSF